MAAGPSLPGAEGEAFRALVAAREAAAVRVEDLRAELAAIAESTEGSPDDEHDAEGSTVGYERARVAGLLEHATRALDEADAALLRVRDGTYGTCIGCGAPIAADRLAALPTTTRCTACAGQRSPRLR